MNLSDKYNLEHDSRLTLPDNTIVIFKHDMIKGHLVGEKISGGNFIKLAKIPINVRIYWNSKYDRSSAKLLDESNRGMRILKQNDDKRIMTFQNFYIWTEGDLSDIDSWTERQRELQIETSGLGGEITPMIANASSEIRVESVDKLHSIRQLENFGKGDNAIDAGEVMQKIQDCTCQTAKNSTQELIIQSDILANGESILASQKELLAKQDELIEKIGDNSGNQDFQEALLKAIQDMQTQQLEYQKQMQELVNEATEILKDIQENGTGDNDMATDMTQTNLLLTQLNQTQSAIKDLQTKIDANAESLNDLVGAMNEKLGNTNEALAQVVSASAGNATSLKELAGAMSGTSANIIENGLKLTTISGTLGDIKNKQIADASVRSAINTNTSTINTKIDTNLSNLATNQNLTSLKTQMHTDLQLLNLESTQQNILEQLQATNISLQNLANALTIEKGLGGEIPDDLTLTAEEYLTNQRAVTMGTPTYQTHKGHIHFRIIPNFILNNASINYLNPELMRLLDLVCNYQVEYRITIELNILNAAGVTDKLMERVYPGAMVGFLGIKRQSDDTSENTTDSLITNIEPLGMISVENRMYFYIQATVQSSDTTPRLGLTAQLSKRLLNNISQITTSAPTSTTAKIENVLGYAQITKVFGKIPNAN